MKFGFIYITTNNINGKRYIGQKTYNSGWETYLGSGVAFKLAVKKYGRENFSRTIIEECEDRNSLNCAEKYWISYYDAVNDKGFYNIVYGGDGISGYKHSDETKEKLRITSSNRKHTEESKRKISEWNKNIK